MSRVRGVQRPHGRLLRQLRRVLGLVRLQHAFADSRRAARAEHISGTWAVGFGYACGAGAAGFGYACGAAAAVGFGYACGAGAAGLGYTCGAAAIAPGYTCAAGAVAPVLGASVRVRLRVRARLHAHPGARRAHPHLTVARPADRPRSR
ncbi:hypothetical protein [Streptomyces sp. NPDC058755]|uniref:hypothetical protein n=1 Tax=Streptomyces sp. NPDC058755 TaxID=3346624 RepID=UPI00367D8883